MSDASIIRLLDEVRWQTLRILDGVADDEARWTPPGLQNSILWHAGHSYVVLEWCTLGSLGREPHYPGGWYEIFSGKDLLPAEVPLDRWPKIAEVVVELKLQRDRLRELFGLLSEAELETPAVNRPKQTVRYMILHGLYDEAAHGGEMWLLRKLQRAQPTH